MRRRLDLAMSLIAQPRVIFLDEPTTGLDPASRSMMWDSIGELVRNGTTILLTTQYLEEADRLADRIVLLDKGGIVATGTADARRPRSAASGSELRFIDEMQLLKATGVLGGIADQQVLNIPSDGTAAHLHHVLDVLRDNGLQPERVSSHRPTLDDVFLALTA